MSLQPPGNRLSFLPFLPETEHLWHHTHTDRATPLVPPIACVQELFLEQTAIRPDAVAVECGAQRLTYAELD
ncbi:MAG: hypothetical protein EOP84_15270, partial [Verrucomicrobiaceae bacterium]